MRFLVQFSMQNMKQWKWRLLSIALLVAITFTLHVLYASFVEAAKSDTLSSVAELNLPYDLLVLVKPRERILSREELPMLPIVSNQNFEMVSLMEPAIHVVVDSAYGSFSVLGVPDDSSIFSTHRIEHQGQWLGSSGEIVLPKEIAEGKGLHIGDMINAAAVSVPGQWSVHHRSFTLVGTYEANDLPQALIVYKDALALTGSNQPNACLFMYPRNNANTRDVRRVIDSARFSDWLRPAYPNATFIDSRTPELLSAKLLATIYQPGQGLLLLTVAFVFIGVTTIAVMTYLERRREFAALKTHGISRKQLITIFSLEYGVAEALGLGLGGVLLFFLAGRINWIEAIESAQVMKLALTAGLYCLGAVVLAVLYPVATALVAAVNQLLYARRIPFRTITTDHLEKPTGEQVYRERAEAMRLLQLTALEGSENDILLLKNIGDRVKKGETVAVQELFFGYVIHEWKSFCDGDVVAIESGGVIGIHPIDDNEPFYPYPKYLLEAQERRLKAFQSATTMKSHD